MKPSIIMITEHTITATVEGSDIDIKTRLHDIGLKWIRYYFVAYCPSLYTMTMMNPIYNQQAHEYETEWIRYRGDAWIRYDIHTWSTMRLHLIIAAKYKDDLIVNQVRNHVGFTRLHDTVFSLYHIHTRIDFISDSSSSSCRWKGNKLQKHIGFIWIGYCANGD